MCFMTQALDHQVVVGVGSQAYANPVEEETKEDAEVDEQIAYDLHDQIANQDSLDEDQMPPLADDDSNDEDDDDEWNWTQIPIQPAKKVERPATRFGGKPEVSYQHSIPKFKGQRSGPKNIPRECETELIFFRLFMDDEIINTFVTIVKNLKSGI